MNHPRPPAATRTAARAMRVAGSMRDVAMLGVGVLGLVGTIPPTVDDLGVTGPAGAVWCLAFVAGAIASLVGTWRQRDALHAAGCMMIGVGFAVWTIAAVRQPEASAVSWMVALVFAAGVFGQVYRSLAIALGVTGIINTAAGLPAPGDGGSE